MKARDKKVVEALRMLISEIKYDVMEAKKDVPDDELVLASLRKALKKREDSFKIYTENKRDDLASNEKSDIDLIKSFLPSDMKESEVLELIKKVLKDNAINDRSGMGKAMKLVMAEIGGRASGQTVSALVKKELA